MPTIRLAARAWDHLMPLATDAVRVDGLELSLDLRGLTPDLLTEEGIDAAETSFSRYVVARSRGDDRLVGLPVFLMRAFRHRCLLVRADSELTSLAELGGTRIGLTGWPDSGHTWTRGLIQASGVDLSAIEWSVGPLLPSADANPGRDEDGLTPAHVRLLGPGDSLTAALEEGRIDVLMTPFMPPGFHRPDAAFRHLIADYPSAELADYRRRGFVPGIHLLTVRRQVADDHPWVLAAVADALERSKHAWHVSRQKYADTTPWMLADIDATVKVFGDDWMPYGTAANARMTREFCLAMHAQGTITSPLDPTSLFTEFDLQAGRQ